MKQIANTLRHRFKQASPEQLGLLLLVSGFVLFLGLSPVMVLVILIGSLFPSSPNLFYLLGYLIAGGLWLLGLFLRICWLLKRPVGIVRVGYSSVRVILSPLVNTFQRLTQKQLILLLVILYVGVPVLGLLSMLFLTPLGIVQSVSTISRIAPVRGLVVMSYLLSPLDTQVPLILQGTLNPLVPLFPSAWLLGVLIVTGRLFWITHRLMKVWWGVNAVGLALIGMFASTIFYGFGLILLMLIGSYIGFMFHLFEKIGLIKLGMSILSAWRWG